MKYYDRLTLAALWTRALQELDTLYNDVERNEAGLSATDHTNLAADIAVLRDGGPLSGSASHHIGRIKAVLDSLLLQETLGERDELDGVNDPEHGAIGRVTMVPILTGKGAEISRIQQDFGRFLFMRDLLSARIDAESQMAGMKIA